MELANGSIRIVEVGTRLQLPAVAPFHVRLAAIACAYAIDELASPPDRSHDGPDIAAVDRVITDERAVFEAEGWRLRGVTELSDGSRGWALR